MKHLKVEIAISKIGKYAVSESGDTAEVVERPGGGISVVIADGQRSGRSAKLISNLVVHKVTSLLAEGVRDGAAARAAHDYLRMYRKGKVSATLAIISVDTESGTIVLSRNSHCPFLVHWSDGKTLLLNEPSQVIGIHPMVRPVVNEFPLEAGIFVLGFTDGLLDAGRRNGKTLDVEDLFLRAIDDHTPQQIADYILEEAITVDSGRPSDDTTVAVLHVGENPSESKIRRLDVSVPIDLMEKV
jgi:serine phosphatase RsbU (regulator of sigma subunit)